MRKFMRFQLQEDFVVKKLISFHYTELNKDFVVPGEKHNFWEFLYMDKGEAAITTGGVRHEMKQGDLIFYTPNEFHSLHTSQRSAPNVLVVCFECHSTSMNRFKQKRFQLTDQECGILSSLLREGRVAFDPPVDRQNGSLLRRRTPRTLGSEQLIKLYLEMLLIHLARKEIGLEHDGRRSSGAKQKKDADIASTVADYLKGHLAQNLTLDELSRTFRVGKTRLKEIFKKQTGCTIAEYVTRLKIDQAKKYIREENWSFTQIAEMLGYSSIHYFSKQFKKEVEMTPSEYDKSLKAKALDP
ncbi:AraC family transcriptional regulator [Paenibacillus sp. CC-CFT747]|nr:AraC family transcriptional regulator [Paenibacillus sp. CC-CFT747]